MNDIILLKLGELVLKGLNRREFEVRLISNLKRRLKPLRAGRCSSPVSKGTRNSSRGAL